MKKQRQAAFIGKMIGCIFFLFISLFPIYWLVAMAIRPVSEMEGNISLLPGAVTLEYFADLFQNERIWTGNCKQFADDIWFPDHIIACGNLCGVCDCKKKVSI